MQFVKSIHTWGKWKIIFLLLVLFNKVRKVIASIFNIGQIKMQAVLYKQNSILMVCIISSVLIIFSVFQAYSYKTVVAQIIIMKGPHRIFLFKKLFYQKQIKILYSPDFFEQFLNIP